MSDLLRRNIIKDKVVFADALKYATEIDQQFLRTLFSMVRLMTLNIGLPSGTERTEDARLAAIRELYNHIELRPIGTGEAKDVTADHIEVAHNITETSENPYVQLTKTLEDSIPASSLLQTLNKLQLIQKNLTETHPQRRLAEQIRIELLVCIGNFLKQISALEGAGQEIPGKNELIAVLVKSVTNDLEKEATDRGIDTLKGVGTRILPFLNTLLFADISKIKPSNIGKSGLVMEGVTINQVVKNETLLFNPRTKCLQMMKRVVITRPNKVDYLISIYSEPIAVSNDATLQVRKEYFRIMNLDIFVKMMELVERGGVIKGMVEEKAQRSEKQ